RAPPAFTDRLRPNPVSHCKTIAFVAHWYDLVMRPLMPFALILLTIVVCSAVASERGSPDSDAPAGWQTFSPRAELRPAFAYERKGGLDGKGCFIIRADAREGLDGSWTRTFPV